MEKSNLILRQLKRLSSSFLLKAKSCITKTKQRDKQKQIRIGNDLNSFNIVDVEWFEPISSKTESYRVY